MLKRNAWLMALMALVSVLPLTWTRAQTAEADDARAVVLDAMHRLLTDSYHYASETQMTTTYTGSDGEAQTVVSVTTAEGDVAPKGDNHMTITSAGGETLDEAQSVSPAEFERIAIAGVIYLNVTGDLKGQLPPLDVEPGWYRFDDLLTRFDDQLIRVTLESLATTAMPAKLPVDDKFILDVTEDAPESVDGVDARVFDVRLDGAGLAIAQTPGSAIEKLEEMVRNRALYAASTFDHSVRVWIDRESGNVLKLHVDTHTSLPYLSTQSETQMGYDIDFVVSSDVMLTRYGEPVEIEAPVTVQVR